ncbi:unnamed protein product [Musa acuminata subsp. malaccensis]|uniref:(wild Malaysian banana) hypothetical protein n=1 Tax=Musa acuminata subsp. malaccensis TaxID=214687 RepID=A0A804HZZ8_MUSAM|nr:unnamed protein product [Musa acuminata subsp. malaccensis]
MGSVSDVDEEARMHALQLAMGSILPMTPKAALELLDIIFKAGPGAKLSPSDIVAQLPTENPQAVDMVDRILRLLASHRVVSCTVETHSDGRPLRKYGATPVCKHLIKHDDGDYIYLINERNNAMYHLKDAVLEGGIPFNKDYGMPAFQYHGTDPRFNSLFHEFMKNHAAIIMKKLLAVYRAFDGIEVLVDVGGGVGISLHMITSMHPHIKAVSYDLPHVISEAPPFPGPPQSGDMFESVPSGDAIVLKWILHDWNDEQCARISRNCWKALPEGGKLIVVEYILPSIPESRLNSQGVFGCAGR